jgi:putative membrane protein
LLGAAWLAAAPGRTAGDLPRFAWARAVREAVSDLLPFSQIGGLVVGARTLTLSGIGAPAVYGSLLADLVTEMASQLIITLAGLGLMATILVDAPQLRSLVGGGVGAMLLLTAAFFIAQRSGLAWVGRVAERLLPDAGARLAEVDAERARIFADRRRIGAAFILNLLAWLATVGGSWLALRLMAAPLAPGRVLSLEVLIFTLRSVGFAVPGALGLQEAAYALAGPILGLPAEVALALSLAKRARDATLGLPTLLLWQAGEARAATRRARRCDEPVPARDGVV